MAQEVTPPKTTGKVSKSNQPENILPENIVVNEIVIRPIDQSSKDIGYFRDARLSAKRVFHANRTRLYDLYTDVEDDGHLSGIIMKRVDAVRNKILSFQKNGVKVDEMDVVIKSEAFRDIIAQLIWSKIQGIVGMEFPPADKLTMNPIERKHIKPDLGIIAYEQNGETGYRYEEMDNLWVVGKRHDLGLLLKCAPYAIWKRGNFGDWAQYSEIFGQPVRIIKYDAYDVKTKMELKEILEESGSALALMIPKQADFDMKDGKQSNGDGQLQERLKDSCNQEMSVIILGNTETTTSGKSSGYAQSKTHSDQQHEVTKTDMQDVLCLLNCDKFIKILKSYGYPVDGGVFLFEKEFNLNDLLIRYSIDTGLSKTIPIADDYFYETYGIPKPDNYNELKAKMEAAKLLQSNKPGDNILPKPGPDDNPDDQDTPNEDKSDQNPANLLAIPKSWRALRHALADFFDPAP